MATGKIGADQLRSVAARLFAKNGYKSTSVRDIAGELGVKAGSLYHHIDAKEDLLFDSIDQALDRLLNAVEIVVEKDVSPTQKFREALTAHLVVGCATVDEMILTVRESGNLAPPRAALIREKRRRYEGLFQSLLKEGLEASELRCSDVRLVSYAVLGMCNWLCQLYSPSGRLSPAQMAEICAEMVIDGLSTEPIAAESALNMGARAPDKAIPP